MTKRTGICVMLINVQVSQLDFTKFERPMREFRRHSLAVEYAQIFFKHQIWQLCEGGELSLPATAGLPKIGFSFDVSEEGNVNSLHNLATNTQIADGRFCVRNLLPAQSIALKLYSSQYGKSTLRVNKHGELFVFEISEAFLQQGEEGIEQASAFRG